MNDKPTHYDGSFHHNEATSDNSAGSDTFQIKDEMRANISGNPFVEEITE
ncbi:hypothetical protein ACERII_17660 [Evansella sp. AB-rgal1]